MRTVHYSSEDNPHVGKMHCSKCEEEVLAWRSSGMSDLCPHFYCSDCSNVIHRETDKIHISEKCDLDVLTKITKTLPPCSCGGTFLPGANPKCPTCKGEFQHQLSPLERLSDPHIILIDGAILYIDTGPKYQARIVGEI